jgi:ankyrin repeat protein
MLQKKIKSFMSADLPPAYLVEACAVGDEARVSALLGMGMDVETEGKVDHPGHPSLPQFYSTTPLSIACRNGRTGVVSLLLTAGATVKGNCLQQASRNGHRNIVELLLAAGATVDTVDEKGLLGL